MVCKKEWKTKASIAGTFRSRARGPWASPGLWSGPGASVGIWLALSSATWILVHGVLCRSGTLPSPWPWGPLSAGGQWDTADRQLHVSGSQGDVDARQVSTHLPVQTWTSLFLPPGTAVQILPYFDSLLVSCVTWCLTGHMKSHFTMLPKSWFPPHPPTGKTSVGKVFSLV